MNIDRHHKGSTVTAVQPVRAFDADFPGWGAPDWADHIYTVEPGTMGAITGVESHGAAPYTRYSIEWVDGSHSYGVDPANVRRH